MGNFAQEKRTDAALLKEFAAEGSEEAFRELVARHSGMVLGVCRRMLGNEAEAEEAAQATFIALALKADRLDASAGLGGWLHRVARQVGADLRKSALRRAQRHQEAVRREGLDSPTPSLANGGMNEELDDAIAALPGKMRNAVIGHYLEGRSLEELAARDGCSLSAISMRLTRSRVLLRKRLTKRGVPVGILSGALLAEATRAAGPAAGFAFETVRAVSTALKGVAATETVAGSLLKIAHEALRRLLFARLKWAFAGGTAGFLVVGGAAFVSQSMAFAKPAPAAPETAVEAKATPGAAPTEKITPVAPPLADPPFIAAIKENNYPFEQVHRFKALLDAQGTLDDIRDARGKTPLHWTAIRGWQDFSELLLRRGADVNATDKRGYTPLFDAIDRNGSIWLQRLLILKGAAINQLARDRSTPLTHAIRRGRQETVEMLLWLGAQTRIENVPEERQPLALARAQGNPAILETVQAYDGTASPTFESKPREIPTFVKDALQEAARVADFEKLDAFLSSGANIDLPDDQGKTALHRAIQAAQPEVVFYLLLLGANPNAADKAGITPLMQTMGWLGESLDAMRLFLIAKGASPFSVRKSGYNELTWAIERDNEHGTQWLLWLGANPREKTRHGTPFQIAFQGGHQRIMDLLRRNGVDEPIHFSDDPVWNLHNAAKRGDNATLARLLDEGVPVDAPDKGGETAMMVAILARNVGTARFLIEHGADIHYQNPKNGQTPLYATMCWDFGEMTEFRKDLLEAGVDPNACLTPSKTTPLMRGIWHTPTTPMKQLIEYGADLNLRDKDGRTALGRALRDGKVKTAEYLRELGAKE